MGPIRTCVGCGARRAQEELVRLVVGQRGDFEVGRKKAGRGAYLCSEKCVGPAMRRRSLQRALRGSWGPQEAERLRVALERYKR